MTFVKHILAPTDFSHHSGVAIHYACDLARQTQATLHLLHIADGNATDQDDEVRLLEKMATLVDARSELALETFQKVVRGAPADTIVQYAQAHNIDQIVMATHGRTGFLNMTVGSVTEQVLRSAPCPVLAVGPASDDNASLDRAIEVLAEQIDKLPNDSRDLSRARMAAVLEKELRVPNVTSVLLLDELERREWVRWDDGRWQAVTGLEVLDREEELSITTKSDSQAIDLIKRARSLDASDIHIDPVTKDEAAVRFRIDGQLKEYCRLDRQVSEHLVNQMKMLSSLDIADPFHPQEGRIRVPARLSDLEVRLTTIPVAGGQAISARLFEPDKVFLPLQELGFSDHDLESVQQMLRTGEGLILVTGPTGSGKTTTVYSMLESIGGRQQNIVSIEDPVECAVPFVRQLNVDQQHGVTMTEGLRTILRMDPDVVFVGEIRDVEAAAIGMRAASSGKYVFSTLHSRDVASTFTALRDLELDDRTLGSNLTGIINQRLARRLCVECREAHPVTPQQRQQLRSVDMEVPDLLFDAVGCDICHNTGYRGRVGVFEVWRFNTEHISSILAAKSTHDVEDVLRSAGTPSLTMDALQKAASGLIRFEDATSIRWLQ